jgi:phenylalanyl-tRNA synthetase alpha chain
MVAYTAHEREIWKLTEEGEEIANTGSHEAKVFNAIPPTGGILIADLVASVFASFAASRCMLVL